jgi:hypothetical protein
MSSYERVLIYSSRKLYRAYFNKIYSSSSEFRQNYYMNIRAKSYSSGSGCKTKTNHSELLKKQQVSHVNNSSLINSLHKSHARNDKYPSSLQFILSARQPKPLTGKQNPLARAYSARAYSARAYSARAYPPTHPAI